MTGQVTAPTIWGLVDDSQTSGFTPVTDTQTATFSPNELKFTNKRKIMINLSLCGNKNNRGSHKLI